ncbi:MAG: amidohydrolase family protein [Acidobacteriota bacterium]
MGEVLKTGVREPGFGDRPERLLIAGGTVWTEEGPSRGDVLVEGERIAAVGGLAAATGDVRAIDVSGCDVLPGCIDVHVHVDDRIGRFDLADDLASGTEIAVRTGITSFFTFVTQRGGETLTQAVERVETRVRRTSRCDVGLHLTPTGWPWNWDEVAALVERGHRTFKLYTTYRDAGLYSDYGRLEEVMRRLVPMGARLLVHCEDDACLAAVDPAGVDLCAAQSHTRLRPEKAEITAIERVVELSGRTGCPVHVVHVSTDAGLELIDRARAHAPVTCETCPQYVLLDDAVLAAPDGHRWLCTPPLRPPATRARLEAAVAASAFELFATDHCPFARTDKDVGGRDIRTVPNGLPGLGALVPLLHDLLVRRHGLPLTELARRLAANPAHLTGTYPRKGTLRPGSDADLVVLDTDGPPRPIHSTLADCHDPWAGRTTRLSARLVLLRGEIVVRNGETLAGRAHGGKLLLA